MTCASSYAKVGRNPREVLWPAGTRGLIPSGHRKLAWASGFRCATRLVRLAGGAAGRVVADATPGNEALAKKEFEIFLRLKPSRGQIAVAQPFLVKLGLKS